MLSGPEWAGDQRFRYERVADYAFVPGTPIILRRSAVGRSGLLGIVLPALEDPVDRRAHPPHLPVRGSLGPGVDVGLAGVRRRRPFQSGRIPVVVVVVGQIADDHEQ